MNLLCCSVPYDSEEDMQAAWDFSLALEKDQEGGSLAEKAAGGDRLHPGSRQRPPPQLPVLGFLQS